MMQSTSIIPTARRAIEEFRTLLAHVRNTALWMQQAFAAIIAETKAYIVELLRVAYAPHCTADSTVAPVVPTTTTLAVMELEVECEVDLPMVVEVAAPLTPRRCVVLTTPYDTTASMTTALHNAVNQLSDMYIPTTVLTVCPELQHELFASYVVVSGSTHLPQIFVEDLDDSANRVCITLDQLEVRPLVPRVCVAVGRASRCPRVLTVWNACLGLLR